MEIKSEEFFINMKSLPKRGTSAFKELIEWETEKCLGGVTIQGVKIPPWLYYHLNHWNIRIDVKDKYENIIREKSLPHLRDNEWIRAEAFERCRLEKKGYIEIGARQGGKSEDEASYIGWNATVFENSQNVVVGSNEADLLLLCDKIQFGLTSIWEGLYRGLIDKDWKNKQVRLGYKDTNNEDHIWSYIMIRNTSDGKNTEVAAGTTAKAFVFDEIGKSLMGKSLEAAKPAFLSEFGWRVQPILVGTGGSFEKADDARRYFFNPEGNNFLAFENEDGRKTGMFMSGEFRQDCKYWTSLREYINSTKGLSIPPGKLDQIQIKVSDKEKARNLILQEREEKKKDPDHSELLKQIMYFPLTIDECFLTDSNNNFPVAAIKSHQAYLKDNYEIDMVDLSREHDGKIVTKSSTKYIVTEFPAKPSTIKNAPVVIYEPPLVDLPEFTYVAGIDPYNENESSDRVNSLGTIYIFKRMHDPTKPFQNSIVASYAGRPNTTREFQQICLDLIEYYGAIALPENANRAFIEWFFFKKKDHLIVNGLPIAKSIKPTTMVTAVKGLSPTTANQRFYMDLMVEYTKEIVDFMEGTETLGCTRIPDHMLLEEMIHYRSKSAATRGIHDGNFDRIVAFGHALVLATILNRDDSLLDLSSASQDKQGFNLSGAFNNFIRPNVKPLIDPFTGKPINQASKGRPIPRRNPFL